MSEVLKIYKCPICGKVEQGNKYKPFCSKRCADVDLGNWFAENYSVPAMEDELNEDDGIDS